MGLLEGPPLAPLGMYLYLLDGELAHSLRSSLRKEEREERKRNLVLGENLTTFTLLLCFFVCLTVVSS